MIDRRRFVRGALALSGLAAAAPLWRAWPAHADAHGHATAGGLSAETTQLLEKSGFVYVSPLRASGAESKCHGEVWFGYVDGAVHLVTSSDSWKARSLADGAGSARVWVGDHGTWNGGANEAFRKAPHFDADVTVSKDAALLDRLMTIYREKYPDGIGKWEPRFRSGFASGERVLLRYAPRG